ncbi:hypothetical protein ABZ847_13705 [Streptomyces bauhiniae]
MTDVTPEQSAQDAVGDTLESNIHSTIALANSAIVDAGLELKAMHTSFAVLSPLESEVQTRAVRWLLDALGMNAHAMLAEAPTDDAATANAAAASSSAGAVPTPRSFMSQKKPDSLVERIACLAYYLTVYRDEAHFKTSDLVSLNTEAAAQKFGNASRDADNADRLSGYLVTAGKGMKQLTPRGEAVVQALPDREAVKAALAEHSYKARRTRDSSPKRAVGRTKEEQ